MSARTGMLWLERALLGGGVALALWCAIVVVEGRYFSTLPPPPVSPAETGLPGGSLIPGPTSGTEAVFRGSWIAKIEAPTVDLAATILEGSDDETLKRGAGHIEDTAFPGEPGNFGIAGHRDTVFRKVKHLQLGDPLDVTTATHVFHYRIAKTSIVDPDDVYVLDPTDHPTLTLVTCYPFEFIGNAPKRFIVHAVLMDEEPRLIR